jgi:hypothetical protein
MAEIEEREAVVVQQKQLRSTVVPNIIFAVCMMAFIARHIQQLPAGTVPGG